MNNLITIVDPLADEADLLKRVLEEAGFGYRCRTLSQLDQLGDAFSAGEADVVLVDQDLIDGTALRLLHKLKRNHRGLRVLILAHEVSQDLYRRAMEHALDGFCLKGDDYPALIDSIEQTIN
ncbi:MAG: response regulator [Candidatus Omnitrophica bacterium]|nr:response regulator [Candidatus Omnitrophota bacterium]MCB9722212.1 response regulator [Candidatus Omnitrophota bacterium]